MDFEKAIQSLIEGDIRAQKRSDLADKRMDKFDKHLKATADLLRAGIKWANAENKKQKERNKEFDFKLNALTDAQNRSEEKFNRWLEEMRKRRTNGHS